MASDKERKFRVVQHYEHYILEEYRIVDVRWVRKDYYTEVVEEIRDWRPVSEDYFHPKQFATPAKAEAYARFLVNGPEIVKEFNVSKPNITNTTAG